MKGKKLRKIISSLEDRFYAIADIKVGEKFTSENIRRIRPGFGIKPKYYNDLIGKESTSDIETGTALFWEHINK